MTRDVLLHDPNKYKIKIFNRMVNAVIDKKKKKEKIGFFIFDKTKITTLRNNCRYFFYSVVGPCWQDMCMLAVIIAGYHRQCRRAVTLHKRFRIVSKPNFHRAPRFYGHNRAYAY